MLNNKAYEIMKWITMIALPAISVFIGAVGVELGISDPDTLVTILNAITVLMGSLIGVSTISYNQNKKDDGND